MITPKEFLIKELTNIFHKIGTIDIRYEFSKEDDTHLIEVTPVSEFDSNNDYLIMERELLFEFNNLFFPSTVLFVSEGSLNQITSPEFVLMRRGFTFSTEGVSQQINWKPISKNLGPILAGENNYSLAA